MNNKKNIAILGSTGEIGQKAVEIALANPDTFQVEVLSADSNAELLIEQAIALKPNHVVIANEDLYQQVDDALWEHDVKSYAGSDALFQIVEMSSIQLVFNAIKGFAGVKPSLSALNAGKTLALANKESLTAAGDLVTALAKEKAVNILPVDFSHSGLFQCLLGDFQNPVTKAYLMIKDESEELRKTLEWMELKWLFGLKKDQINLVKHPENIVHSMVQFSDGSMKAQMGENDLSSNVQFALSYPARLSSEQANSFNLLDHPSLSFEAVDLKSLKILSIAQEVVEHGGNMPCALNAALNVVLGEFELKRIDYNTVVQIVDSCMQKVTFVAKPSYNDYVTTDLDTRKLAKELL